MRSNVTSAPHIPASSAMWSSTGPSVSVPSTGTRMRSYTPMVSASPERGVQQEHVEPDDQRRDQHADGSGDGTRALIAHHAARPAEPEHGDDGERQLQAPVSYTHLRAHETVLDLVCRLLL